MTNAEAGKCCWCGHAEEDHVVIIGAQHCMECDPNMRSGGPVESDASLFDLSSYVGASFIAAGHDFGEKPRPTPEGYYYGPKERQP